MKKVCVLVLALFLFGALSATAWAAEEIVITKPAQAELDDLIGYNARGIIIEGQIPTNVNGSANSAGIVYTLTSNAGNPIFSRTNDRFTLTLTAETIRNLPNQTVIFTLTKDVTPYDAKGKPGLTQSGILVDRKNCGPFNIAPQVKLTANNLKITCSDSRNHSFEVTNIGSSSTNFRCTIPQDCISAAHNITIATQNLDSGLSANIQNPTVAANTSGAISRAINISNGVDTATYYLDFVPAAAVDLLYAVNIRAGAEHTSASLAGFTSTVNNGSGAQTLSIAGAYDTAQTFYAHVTVARGVTLSSASFGGKSAAISNGNTSDVKVITLSLPASTTVRELVLNFSEGHRATINLTFGTVILASAVSIRTDAKSNSAPAVSSNALITSDSGKQTMSIPVDYNKTRTFYAHITLAGGTTLNSATIDGTNATINNGSSANIKVITLPFPTTDVSRDVVLNFSGGHSAAITITRDSDTSADSTLINLEARYGIAITQTLNLIPAFDQSVTNYRVNVETAVNQIAFRPTASDNSAEIRVTGSTMVESGQWTGNNILSNDTTTFSFQVTSADGNSTSHYTVAVTRGLSVVVSPQKLRINGLEVNCAAYNINGNNYFKLRDIAYALRGTAKKFDIIYNEATRMISMIHGRDYTVIGGEMVRPPDAQNYLPSSQRVQLDGKPLFLTAYNVDGSNYFMLREIGALFDFAVDYDAAINTMQIDTDRKYAPD